MLKPITPYFITLADKESIYKYTEKVKILTSKIPLIGKLIVKELIA